MNSTTNDFTCHLKQNSFYNQLSSSIPKKLLEKLMHQSERKRVFDPLSTLFLYLTQIYESISSKGALCRLNLIRKQEGLRPVSLNTGCFSRAKKKICENLIRKIALSVKYDSSQWKWKNHIVKFVDGTTMTMEDTEENQLEYPQNFKQKKGLGQPILRALAVFCYATGSIIDLELAPYKGKGNGEISLLKKMLNRFKRGDILVMDRLFTSYYLHFDIQARGIDFLVRIRDRVGERNFKKNERDKIINVKKDFRRGKLTREEYLSYPECQELRIIKYISQKNGFRDKTYYFMTSLKNNHSTEEIARLYLSRWDAEINIRSLKRTLGSYFLKSKTPEMVRKEIYIYILGYNLIRKFILFSSGKTKPQKISFKTSLFLFTDILRSQRRDFIHSAVVLLSTQVLNSKFRIEPRHIKKRHKGTYGYLMKPRWEFKPVNALP